MKRFFYLFFMTALLPSAIALPQERPRDHVLNHKHTRVEYGIASYYANRFQGRPMSGGEMYDKNKMTCAHNSLPLGTLLKVTNLKNKKSVIVKVTDRLHHSNKRVVDLSWIAASKLGYTASGLAKVKVEIIGKHRLPKQVNAR